MKNNKGKGPTERKKEEQMRQNQATRNTTGLTDEEMDAIPDTGDDYRLPRDLPEPEGEMQPEENIPDEEDQLTDDNADISSEELSLLDSTDYDSSSDESVASDLLENEDDEGDELNEGSGDDSLFDTGEDLDMPGNITNPDADIDEEEE